MLLLPIFLPDELLFSGIVRHFTLTGLPVTTYLTLIFGSDRHCLHPLLTANLNTLSKYTHGSCGNLARTATLTPLFAYFLPDQAAAIFNAQYAESGSRVVRACQVPNFRQKEDLVLQYCPACVKTDLSRWGMSYWHRVHQLPGMRVCPHHRCYLVKQPLLPRQRLLRNLLPPDDKDVSPAPCMAWDFSCFMQKQFRQISQPGCEPFRAEQYWEQLRQCGYLTRMGHVRRKSLLISLYSLSISLGYVQSELVPRSAIDFRYISALLETPYHQHPFKHLLFGYWLQLERSRSTPLSSLQKTHSRRHDKVEKPDPLTLLSSDMSLLHISRLTGRSRCYLKRLAALKGITVGGKTRLVDDILRAQVMLLAYRGFHRKEISRRHGLSIGIVEQLISSVPGLVAWRRKARHDSKYRRYKVKILRYRESHPEANRQRIKQDCTAAYFWLYHHQREFLECHLPKKEVRGFKTIYCNRDGVIQRVQPKNHEK